VLGRIKAKPSVAADEAASLDTTCARRRLDPTVGARESLRRGRTREMTCKEAREVVVAIFRLRLSLRLENGSALARTFFTFAGLVGAAMCSAFVCGSHDRWP
jgi:hypothetical protein